MFQQISEKAYWCGKIDWTLNHFHGEELTTEHGSSYNAYLIKDEKTVLIDTVYYPFSVEFINNLVRLVDPATIDYIVINHAEPDHAGCIADVLRLAPNATIVCSPKGVQSIKGNFHVDGNFMPVKNGDKLNIGSQNLTFIDAGMLHWPDSMMTYADGEGILFSNDAFGQHYASDLLYADLVDTCALEYEALKYFANILSPFIKLAKKKVDELNSLKLPIKMIAPSHGMIWRKNLDYILNKYIEWCNSYKEDIYVIALDTMYESTRIMAEAIAEGIRRVEPNSQIKLYNCSRSERSDIITEIFRSKKFLVGSPTINNGMLGAVAALLEEIRGHAFIGKKASAFGSYGWAPMANKSILAKLQEAGVEVIGEGVKANWFPTPEALEECRKFGEDFAKA